MGVYRVGSGPLKDLYGDFMLPMSWFGQAKPHGPTSAPLIRQSTLHS